MCPGLSKSYLSPDSILSDDQISQLHGFGRGNGFNIDIDITDIFIHLFVQ